jgi:predicted nucleic acid-binding protein
MTSLIVDASVAAKWFVQETDSAAAKTVAAGADALVAPELILAEVANVLWKKIRKGSMHVRQASEVMRDLPVYFDRLVPLASLGSRAIELANDLKHPVYDCFYLALAEREGIPIVSADARLLTAAAQLTGIEARGL